MRLMCLNFDQVIVAIFTFAFAFLGRHFGRSRCTSSFSNRVALSLSLSLPHIKIDIEAMPCFFSRLQFTHVLYWALEGLHRRLSFFPPIEMSLVACLRQHLDNRLFARIQLIYDNSVTTLSLCLTDSLKVFETF